MKTPDWILKGFDSKADWEKKHGIVSKKKAGKTFKVRRCPKCKGDHVGVVVEKEKSGEWECKKCGWSGRYVKEDELNEEEFMKYLDEKGEDVA